MTYDWSVVWEHWPEFLGGVWMTIVLAVVTMAISIPLGIVVMLLRQSGIKAVEAAATVFVELFRNVPLLLLVFWAYYAIPRMSGMSMSNLTTGIIALVLNTTAYNSENFRAGVNSIRCRCSRRPRWSPRSASPTSPMWRSTCVPPRSGCSKC